MNEEQQKCNQGGNSCMMCRLHNSMCGKDMCGTCGGRNHHFLLRIILGIGIIVFVFWMGVHVGMFVGEDRGYNDYGGYGGGMHNRSYNDYGGYRGMGPGMMYNNNYNQSYEVPQQVQVRAQGGPVIPVQTTQSAPAAAGSGSINR
jgi:hypothetical protein